MSDSGHLEPVQSGERKEERERERRQKVKDRQREDSR